jgi:hypothetical protein
VDVLSTLGVKIDAALAGKGASEVNRHLDSMANRARRVGNTISGSFKGAVDSLFSIKGAAVAAGGALLFGQLTQTIGKFESLSVSLETVTGSSEKAADALYMIRNLASNTPFSVEKVTEAFIKLKAMGLDPSEEAIISYGNTSSAMGKDLSQMIEAVADASTGEFERLKEFGIRSSKQGEQVRFTFQGVTTTVKMNSKEIQDYLRKIGDTQFAGGMAKQMDTVNGKISNLGDKWDELLVSIGDAGARDGLKLIFDLMINSIDATIDDVNDVKGVMWSFFAAVDKGVLRIETDFKILGATFDHIYNSMRNTGIETIATLIEAHGRLLKLAPVQLYKDAGQDAIEYADALRSGKKDVADFDKTVTDLEGSYKRQAEIIDQTVTEQIEADDRARASRKKYVDDNHRVAKSTDDAAEALKRYKEMMKEGASITEDMRTPMEVFIDGSFKIEELFQKGAVSFETRSRYLKQLQKDLDDSTDATRRFGYTVKELDDILEKGKALTEDARTPAEIYKDQIFMVEELFQAEAVSWETRNRMVEKYDKELKESQKKTNEEMNQFVIQAARNMQSAMADSFLSVMEGDFDSLEQNFFNMLNRMIAQALAAKAAMALFGDYGNTGEISGLVGSIIGAFGSGGAAGATGTSFIVGGSGGIDSQTIPLKVSPGERVTVETPTQQNEQKGSVIVNNSFHVVSENGYISRESQQQLAAKFGGVLNNAIRRQ